METTLTPYIPVALLLVVGALLSLAMVGVTRIMGPRFTSAIKSAPFESGSEPIGSARERFSVKFYLVALLFIVFDVEAVFIYPWAVLLKRLGWPAMISMIVFMSTLVVGLIYVWKKGALEWGAETAPMRVPPTHAPAQASAPASNLQPHGHAHG